jgi:hypothetical protein
MKISAKELAVVGGLAILNSRLPRKKKKKPSRANSPAEEERLMYELDREKREDFRNKSIAEANSDLYYDAAEAARERAAPQKKRVPREF